MLIRPDVIWKKIHVHVSRPFHRDTPIHGINTVDPNSLSRVNGRLSEKTSSCEVAWVPHDANSGHTLPADVLIGGVLTATNTPLYVVRQKLNEYHITGNYNPVSNIAWAEIWISGNVAINNTVFEVMTVTGPWQYWLTDDEKWYQFPSLHNL